MKRTLFVFALILGCQILIGCQRSTPKEETPEKTPPQVQSDWPYSPEQIAEAKQFATELGAKIGENADGEITLLDMAKNRTWASDSQMEEILILPKLETLVLEGPSITDMILPRIAETPSLVSLTMKNTLVSDEGIAQLTALKNLKVVDLRQSPMMTDAAMESLAKIPSLKAVRLIDTQITDAGIAALLSLPQLSELDLRYCQNLTADGLKKLGETKSLQTLMLGGSKIDDATLKPIAEIKGLKKLVLNECNVSDEAVKQLQESLPECKIQKK